LVTIKKKITEPQHDSILVGGSNAEILGEGS